MTQISGKLLEIKNLSIHFTIDTDKVHALSDVSLELSPNEVVCLLGPSGCGKSTLLRIIGGFETHYTGDVGFRGNPVHAPSVERGFIFQEARLFPWMTIHKNVAFGLRDNMDKHGKADTVQRVLRLVGLENFAGAYPHQLSGGMQQRISIARALVNNPSLLLLDEPFGALDAFTRIQMQNEILGIWEKEKTTMLLVTHDIDEAVALADRVMLMTPRPGRIKRVVEIPLSRPGNATPRILSITATRYIQRFSRVWRTPNFIYKENPPWQRPARSHGAK